MRSVQRIAALAAMWLVLWYLYSTTDVDYGWAVWCVWAIALVLEFLAFHLGLARGVELYLSLTAEQRKRIEDVVKEIDNDAQQ